MKTAFMLKGEPGVGKSTLALMLAPDHTYSADDFPGLYKDGVYQFDQQQASHEWNFMRVEQAMQEGIEVMSIANTSCKRKYYQQYLDLAAKYGYAVPNWHGEGILLPDGSSTTSIHNVPIGTVLRMRGQYEPYVHQIQIPWRQLATGGRTLRILDKDKTLVYNPNGGIPKVYQQKPVHGMREKLAEFKDAGDFVAIATNQGGLTTRDRETGEFYKTISGFKEEVMELWELFPEIDYLVACPDMNGRTALQFNPVTTDFDEISGSDFNGQPFRKPAAGMYELIFQYFSFQFKDVYAYGDSPEDRLAALAADVPFLHVHDLIYGG